MNKKEQTITTATLEKLLHEQAAALEKLQKELQVEAALEKVRSRALAMHGSDELKDVVTVVFEKLQALNFAMQDSAAIIFIFTEDSKEFIQWIADPGQAYPASFKIPYYDNPLPADIFYAKESGNDFFSRLYPFEIKNEYFNFLLEKSNYKYLPDEIKNLILESKNYGFSIAFSKNSAILIPTNSGNLLSENEAEILKRFAKVFEQAYVRFLDLQKAEAQAREAQIEAALEKVRSRSLAMHKSDELEQVVASLFDRLVELGMSFDGAAIYLFEKEKRNVTLWVASRVSVPLKVNLPYDAEISGNLINQDLWNAIEKDEDILNKSYSGKIKNDYYLYVGNNNKSKISEQIRTMMMEAESWTVSFAAEKNCVVGIDSWAGRTTSDEDFKIVKRFARVFEQAYTRFLDLQKAEAQAREAQIEAALERVRSRAMAMQNSKDLNALISRLFDECTRLDLALDRCIVTIVNPQTLHSTWILSNPETPTEPSNHLVQYHEHKPYLAYLEAWKKRDERWHYILEGDEKKRWDKFLFFQTELSKLPDAAKEGMQSFSSIHINNSFSNFGSITLSSFEFLTEPQWDILIRFTKVFDLTYTRYNDLKQAEAQARESQIQLALERVRARTMAMQKSDELANVSELLFKQVSDLGIKTWATGFNIWSDDNNSYEDWITSPRGGVIEPYIVNAAEFPAFIELSNARKSGKHFYVQYMDGEMLKQTYEELLKFGNKQQFEKLLGDEFQFPTKQYLHIVFGSKASLMFVTYKPVPEAHDIFKRFGKTFEQTYTRFLDLQKAEAQAREAQVEAALERVRSRTLAMQKSDELAETSAVLFKQLISLGISPHRLYISIMKDNKGNTEFWITDEDGSKVSMAYEDNLNNNLSFKKMYDGWRQQKKSLVIDIKGKEPSDYFHYLGEELHVPFKDGLAQKRRLQYIAYFSKGFIGMASPDEQPAETLQLLEKFAYVFNLTFTRFNDLQIAEAHALQAEQDLIQIKAARKKAEETLSELQSTQKQLIQSEKMASLGELTAGIAHEIQNPLNFVNNFSEVSKELLDEMKVALENGDKDEAEEIANDIIQNLEKINHHGKRADAIVKGMLQHSRKSSGQKEPTDINALCDEYIRLCYHGLRAKDKSFNSNINTDFDSNINKINTIPQDVGRVLLNILTNAFYAVNEKQKAERLVQNSVYKPTVSIQTKRLNDTIEIRIEDNGCGIPSSIISKIFQPFFTTKPTGQGTGLGLSLAYDIITKEHSGTIEVKSKEGEYSRFIIQLPAA